MYKNTTHLFIGVISNQLARHFYKNNAVALVMTMTTSIFSEKPKYHIYGGLLSTAYSEFLSPNKDPIKIKDSVLFFDSKPKIHNA
jgi:hypothetical protein